MDTVTEAYRSDYRRGNIGRRYSGPGHFMLTVGVSLAVIGACVAAMSEIVWWEWLAVPVTFLYANLVEYFGHRGPMHHRRRGFGPVYDRHTRQHHRFFTARDMAYDRPGDLKAVLFPPVLILFFLLAFFVPTGVLIAVLTTDNLALLYVATGMAYFLNYETLHLIYHLPDKSVVWRIPGLRALQRLHRTHHEPAIMARVNFNITYPIGDWLFGTLRR